MIDPKKKKNKLDICVNHTVKHDTQSFYLGPFLRATYQALAEKDRLIAWGSKSGVKAVLLTLKVDVKLWG